MIGVLFFQIGLLCGFLHGVLMDWQSIHGDRGTVFSSEHGVWLDPFILFAAILLFFLDSLANGFSGMFCTALRRGRYMNLFLFSFFYRIHTSSLLGGRLPCLASLWIGISPSGCDL